MIQRVLHAEPSLRLSDGKSASHCSLQGLNGRVQTARKPAICSTTADARPEQMTDTLTPRERSHRMRAVRQHNTDIEVLVRRLIHRSGYRFRLNVRDLPGSPDIVLPRHKTVCFVHGCLWHGDECRAGRLPATNHAWWAEKIAANRRRDQLAASACSALGWRVITVWQCALKGKGRLLPDKLQSILAANIAGGPDFKEIRGTHTLDLP